MARWLDQIRLYPMRAVKSLALYTCLLTLGMGAAIIGPTLLDLRTQVFRTLTEVSAIMPARSGGYALGSFLSEYTN